CSRRTSAMRIATSPGDASGCCHGCGERRHRLSLPMLSPSVHAVRSPSVWAEETLLEDLRDGLIRQPRVRAGGSSVHCRVDGRDVVIFSSNDYLGLSTHRAVREAAGAAALQDGVGSTGSRHLTGSHEAMLALEAELAAFEGAETATLAP